MSTDDLKDGGFRKDDFASQEDIPPIPEALPVLPVQDAVTYPYTIVPLLVSTDKGIGAVDEALSQNRMVLLLTQRDQSGESPDPKDMYDFGTVGIVIRMVKLQEQKILWPGVERGV